MARFVGRAIVTILLVTFTLINGSLAQAQTILNLNNFIFSNGAYPRAPLIFDASGNLYGTTTDGGDSGCGGVGCGVVFQLTNSGGTWSENVLWVFGGGRTDGCGPFAGLIMDSAGNLFGTTHGCGAHGRGTVFELTYSGGVWGETVLHSFTGQEGGGVPNASLVIDADGNLYGTTRSGGGGGCLGGCGVVFELTNNHGIWTETVLHIFQNDGRDGIEPGYNVTLDAKGNIYGTTATGGAFGYGVAFKLTKTTKGWTETILHSFSGLGDGGNPSCGLITDGFGNLYGTTEKGATGYGAVFELHQIGIGKWSESLVHFFDVSDGADPIGNLVFDNAGSLYGTTFGGGAFGLGTVFKLMKSGGGWTETVLWSFQPKPRNQKGAPLDGFGPIVGLVLDTNSDLYGTSGQGGLLGYGLIYEITP
ncbi:MAG TPA: choice-of-anchor tandem repeat GloVer-containing protein [Terriglobales bacterium]|nr:choice-of-anchor tandem repeat GloVer-containing protein [Terriglobales bacterium]